METFIYLNCVYMYMVKWEEVLALSDKSVLNEIFSKTMDTEIDPTALTIAMRVLSDTILERVVLPRGLRVILEHEAYFLAEKFLEDTSHDIYFRMLCDLFRLGSSRELNEKFVWAAMDQAYPGVREALDFLISVFNIEESMDKNDLIVLARDMVLVYYYRLFCFAEALGVAKDFVLKVCEYYVDKYLKSNDVII